MRKSGKCPKCDSKDIIQNSKAVGRVGYINNLHVATYSDPQALVFKGEQSTQVYACVCGSCGFIEFYAESPRSLKIPLS